MKPLPALLLEGQSAPLLSPPGQILLSLAGGAQTEKCAELHPASSPSWIVQKEGGPVGKNKNDLKHHIRL